MLCGLVVYVTAWSSLVAIPVCKQRGQTMHCSPAAAGAPTAASPRLQGLVNLDPFIEGVLSEGSEVTGHTHRLEVGGKTTFSIIVVVIVRRAIGGHWPAY